MRLSVNNPRDRVLLVTRVPMLIRATVWLVVFLLAMGQPSALLASDYFGQVTFNGPAGPARHADTRRRSRQRGHHRRPGSVRNRAASRSTERLPGTHCPLRRLVVGGHFHLLPPA